MWKLKVAQFQKIVFVTTFFGHHNVLSPKLMKLQQIHIRKKVMCLWIDNMVMSIFLMNSMHFVNSLELQSISQMFKKKKVPLVENAHNMLIFQMHYGWSNCNNLSYIVWLFFHKCSFTNNFVWIVALNQIEC